ncbi:hypothetical protein GWN26_14215 [Candidatus Saccharibacteria bacterium]|nr:hypothetical protein [Candidatus Saccharibacteria bacterium]NIV04410.1 hypothetical protein [Calditrichia bacterium]NIS38469.1 hypothetical protein [Candidatus Saccharibacteria bacterium]NIV72959.1 hypothetical protein [Calditrichia bacterium]NIW00202.1 hypothetical protein [Candidatus Saccharibacteria bacterium]
MPEGESREHSGLVELGNIRDIALLKEPSMEAIVEKAGLNIEKLEALQKSDPVELNEAIGEPISVIRDHLKSIENLLKEIKEDIDKKDVGEEKAA